MALQYHVKCCLWWLACCWLLFISGFPVSAEEENKSVAKNSTELIGREKVLGSVKKELKDQSGAVGYTVEAHNDMPLQEQQLANGLTTTVHMVKKENDQPPEKKETKQEGSHVVVDEAIFKQKMFPDNDAELLDSYRSFMYFFVALSAAAVLLIALRVYRLRLSRAERKYGVQGDRSTQELTPLPVSIEDINSDEEDQTLFDINRHNIRIL